MKASIVLFFTLLFGILNPSAIELIDQEEGITTYYLIRHAEKDRSDSSNHNPDLTEAGKQRAENWAKVLKDINFDAIYSTDYNRTLQTATPLARHNNLEILNYDPDKLYSEEFKNMTSGKTVMVVGHSNTTPQFVNRILGEKKYENIDDSENGALFIVHVFSNGDTMSKVLYIN